jgi:hypothetical protein
MKNIIVFIILTIIATGAFAQINVASNGNVGVKTTTPSSDFTVNGEIRILSPATPAYGSAIRTKVTNKNACAYHLYSNYYGQDVFYVSGTGYLWCKLGGYFGSDINMKENIKDIETPLNKVLNLHGVTYKFKDDKTKDSEKDERMGLIAQEVEKVIPEVVKEMNDGTKAIAYTDLIGIMVEAMKEQQAQIEELKEQVSELSSNTKK